MLAPVRSLSCLSYRGPGKLAAAIYHDTDEENDQDRYLILVHCHPDFVVALYADGDFDWACEHYFGDYITALSHLLQKAAQHWDIDWFADWGTVE